MMERSTLDQITTLGIVRRLVLASLISGAIIVPLNGQDDPTGLGDTLYTPAPILSPSTDLLRFDGVKPGESRTTFMDLANLGIGEIVLDSMPSLPASVSLKLQTYRLRPGQFVRFPVTFTQPGLDSVQAVLRLPWQSPEYGITDTLLVRLVSSPQEPLVVQPGTIRWRQVLRGGRFRRSLRLINTGKEPIYIEAPSLPPSVTATLIPQVLTAGQTATAMLFWQPESDLSLDSLFTLHFRILSDSGSVEVRLVGEAVPPVQVSEDTLRLTGLVAGSRYSHTLTIHNHSDEQAALVLDTIVATPALAVDWLRVPEKITLGSGQAREVTVNFSPALAGSYPMSVTYRQQSAPADSAAPVHAPVKVNIVAEVGLPISSELRSIRFGSRPVRLVSTETLRLVNLGHGSLTVRLEQVPGSSGGIFSFPPLGFKVVPGGLLEIPVHFRPPDMEVYSDSIDVVYQTFGMEQRLRINLSGEGADRPIARIGSIADVTLDEDFAGWHPLAGLDTVFVDPNHAITYRLEHTLERIVRLGIVENRLGLEAIPHRYGAGDVILEASNTVGESVADTFHVEIKPVNDLPLLAKPVQDLVLREDSPPRMLGRLAEIFVDYDRETDTIATHYNIHATAGGDGIQVTNRSGYLYVSVRPNWSGSRSFVLEASDPLDTTVVAFDLFKITVLPVNDPPAVAPLPDIILDEDAGTTVSWAAFVNDPDDDNTSLQLSFQHTEGGLLPITFTPVGPLLTEIRPQPNWAGDIAVTMLATDDGGQTGGNTFNITVIPRNDPPLPFRAAGPVTTDVENRLIFTGPDTLVTFRWESSVNLDPDDAVVYTWQLLDTTRSRAIMERSVGEDLSVSVSLDKGGLYYWTVMARDREGATASSDTLPLMLESIAPIDGEATGTHTFGIGPNYPNPFNTSTRIKYYVPRFAEITITLYDAAGRQVRVLKKQPQYRGNYTVIWDGLDSQGRRVASGPYVAELRGGPIVAHAKLVVLH